MAIALDADIADGHATYQTNGDGSLVARPVGGWADTPGQLVSIYDDTTGALLTTANASMTPVAAPDPMAGWYRWDATITAWTAAAGALLPPGVAASAAGSIGLRGALPLPAGTGASAGGTIAFTSTAPFGVPAATAVTSGGGLSLAGVVGLPAGTSTSAGGAITQSMVTTWYLPAATATSSAGGITISAPTAASVSDDFNRANGGLGANWTTITNLAAPQIATNQIGVGTGRGARYSGATFAANQYAEAKSISGSPADKSTLSKTQANGPAVRVSASAETYYLGCIFDWDDGFESAGRAAAICKCVAGTFTEIHVVDVPVDNICRIEAEGTTLRLYTGTAHGSLTLRITLLNQTDIASGSAGVVQNASFVIDDWYGGDI
jgi:hypothetical protein